MEEIQCEEFFDIQQFGVRIITDGENCFNGDGFLPNGAVVDKAVPAGVSLFAVIVAGLLL